MKLAAQYNRATLAISFLVLLIAGFVYYAAINFIVDKQLDHDLTEEMYEVVEYINTHQQLPAHGDFDGNQTSFVKTEKSTFDMVFFDVPYHKTPKSKQEAGRAIRALVSVKGNNYIATVAESKEASENLSQLIIGITLMLTVLLLAILAVTNRYVFGGLWKPFYTILHQLKAFNIADANSIESIKTDIDEFRELNDAVVTMSAGVKHDYQNLKTFTENASHEMLTPIAVITSKLDTLIQDEKLKSEQFTHINDIYIATNKLSRLNQSLLLLVKIENDLIQDNTTFNLKDVILEKVKQFQELAQNKDIEIIHLLDDKEITASKYLIEILINNLFNNAIKHNIANGKIYIKLSRYKLLFQNTGEVEALEADKIFERFNKGKNSEGTGLGLTIASNICTQYSYKLTYNFESPFHTFKVVF